MSATWGGITAPRFTDEDKVEEWDAMSTGEHSRIRADVMGDSTRREAERSARMSNDLTGQMLQELAHMPSSETVAVREAQQRCPEEFNDERRLDLFLVREDYEVSVRSDSFSFLLLIV